MFSCCTFDVRANPNKSEPACFSLQSNYSFAGMQTNVNATSLWFAKADNTYDDFDCIVRILFNIFLNRGVFKLSAHCIPHITVIVSVLWGRAQLQQTH